MSFIQDPKDPKDQDPPLSQFKNLLFLIFVNDNKLN